MFIPTTGIFWSSLSLAIIALLMLAAALRRLECQGSAAVRGARKPDAKTDAPPSPPSEIAAILTGKPTLREALDAFLEFLARTPGVDCGGVYLVRQSGSGLDLVAHRGLSSSFVREGRSIEPGSPRSKLAMAGTTLIRTFGDIMASEHNSDMVIEGLRSAVVVPVKHHDQVVATLNMGSHVESRIPASSLKAIESAASCLGDVIVRFRAA
jgi:hypothetical protein